MITILQEKIAIAKAEGWTVETYVNGQNAPTTRQSMLCKALEHARKKYPAKQVDYLVGQHRARKTEGYAMAVIVKDII